ncbi:MAG TPA: SUMF1/EgtB/PvdO family nonheme iron enzyme [Spongiibacteraceae bacterium]|jgi:formylglycine-generating enzyme required for sulfatase activity
MLMRVIGLLICLTALSVWAENTANLQLFYAVEQSSVKLVEAAITAGADINAIGDDELTPLMSASIKKEPDVVQVLLRHGADVNKSNRKGQAALMAAVAGGDIGIVKVLLANGAKVDAATKDGKHAIDIARSQNKEDIAVLLEEKSAHHANFATTSSAPRQPSVDVQSYTGPIVTIPAGTFQMGGVDGPSNEKPQHSVSIHAYKLAQYEVTVEQFTQFIDETGYDAGNRCVELTASGGKLVSGSFRSPGFLQEKHFPAVCISWEDAQAYVIWLSKKTGLHFRLPSEAEWEYAARAGSSTNFVYGDDPSQVCKYANGLDAVGSAMLTREFGKNCTALSCADNAEYTTTVGRYLPNAFGLYDMYGNAWEWVQDCYHASFDGAPAEGVSWVVDQCEKHVERGGSWNSSAAGLRTTYRDGDTSGYRSANGGFRLARDF